MTDSLYKDDDLVYVDPDSRTVIGKVEWSVNGKPKSMLYQVKEPSVVTRREMKGGKVGKESREGKESKEERRRTWGRKYYPWGTYKSMRKIYKLEGKQKEPEPNLLFEEVLPKALKDVFWD